MSNLQITGFLLKREFLVDAEVRHKLRLIVLLNVGYINILRYKERSLKHFILT